MTTLESSPTETPPLVFIGMPVYNEQRFIADALSDLANQDYANFTLLISDNASTDDTRRICESFAQQHTHVEYQRLPQNVGASENFQRVLRQASGDYFMWAAGHDRWDSNYLTECVKALEASPGASIAFGTGDWIDAQGKPMARECGWTDTRGMTPIARYFSVLWGNMHPILGLIRLSHMQRAHPLKAVTGSDLVVLTELVLMGDFIHAVATHWSRREYRSNETYDQKLKRYRSPQYGLTRTRLGRFFPLAALPFELLKVVFRTQLSLGEKIMLLLLLPPSFLIKYLSSRK